MMGKPESLVTRDPRDLLAPRDMPVPEVQADPMDWMEVVVTPEKVDPKAIL